MGGGIKLKEEKVYTLAYADDIVMIAEEEHGMKAMLSRLERYLERKGLELNVEIMVRRLYQYSPTTLQVANPESIHKKRATRTPEKS